MGFLKKRRVLIIAAFVVPLVLGLVSGGSLADPGSVPVKGMVTMVDLGATSCIPCKMMAPIIEELKKEYEGRASIVFIDVWKHKEEASKYGISAIPTQIFFDKDGKEAYRHVGFMDKKSVVEVLERLGVK